MGRVHILVTGASIAGPTVAYWLSRAGHEVTVVERFEALRGGGQNVDVRGRGREVLRRMGLERQVLDANTGEVGLRFVDDHGRALAEFPVDLATGDGFTAEVEILRGRLSEILVDACRDVEYVFGDSVVAVRSHADGVDVTFAGGGERRFDLLIVAEGTRSRTRDLVFDDVDIRPIGLYTAYGTIPRSDGDDQWWNWYNTTGGRSVTVRPDDVGTTRVGLSFLSPPRGYEGMPIDAQRDVLARVYAGAGWEVPRILHELSTAEELYVDHLAQVYARRWSAGRVVLIGDAAWCATPLSGAGTTLAITGAYLLAGELATHVEVSTALRQFEIRMRPIVDEAQRLPPGVPRVAHPRTRAGLAALRLAVRAGGSRPVRALTGRLGGAAKATPELPSYDFGRHLA